MSNQAATEFEGLSAELRAYWRQIPDKPLFFGLLGAWLALFQFLGNATFGYIDNPSLFRWMYVAYNAKNNISDDSFANFVPVLVLGLMWWKRNELVALPLKAWWPGIVLVALGLFFHFVGYMFQYTQISILALFTGIYGLMGLTWGPQLLRATFFPFFLFAFMMPLGSQTERVAFPLQILVTKIVATFCTDILGITVNQVGTQLFNGAGTYQYEVAAACSGIRSLVAIGVMSIIYAFTVFRAPWKRLLMMACAVPLAVLGNAVRLFLIILAAEFGGQKAGQNVHDSAIWSLVPYVPAVVGLYLVGRWLEGPRPRATPPTSGLSEQPSPS